MATLDHKNVEEAKQSFLDACEIAFGSERWMGVVFRKLPDENGKEGEVQLIRITNSNFLFSDMPKAASVFMPMLMQFLLDEMDKPREPEPPGPLPVADIAGKEAASRSDNQIPNVGTFVIDSEIPRLPEE